MTDIIIIGGGPAGVSAALTAKNRGKLVTVISNPIEESNLYKAEQIDNYPGVSSISGRELCELFRKQLDDAGINTASGRVISAMPMGDSYYVSTGAESYQAKAVIIACGVVQTAAYPGEREFLGRGVSYCATCDGMLYRGKKIAVIGLNSEAEEETQFLRSIGCEVEYFDKTRAKKYEVKGGQTVEELIADGEAYPVSGVFILRPSVAPDSLLPGLKVENGHIAADNDMATSLPGVFAAGDCVGAPYQVARAAGQGNTAAISACKYLDKQ